MSVAYKFQILLEKDGCGTRRNLLGTWQVRKTLLSIKWKLQRVMKNEAREGPGKNGRQGQSMHT